MSNIPRTIAAEVRKIQSKPKGLSNSSSAKWNGLRPIIETLTGLPRELIHLTRTTGTANIPKRYTDGRPKKHHLPFCMFVCPDKIRKAVIKVGKDLIGPGIQQFNCIVRVSEERPEVTDIIADEDGPVVRRVRREYPSATLDIISPSSASGFSSAISPKTGNASKLVDAFITTLKSAKLSYKKAFLSRFVASLLAKPFVILTGLSGSGKTKLAEAFAKWLGTPFGEGAATGSKYLLVPVGSDWTTNEHLLGYPDALQPPKDGQPGRYCLPDSKVLQFVLAAEENNKEPYFLILDEMNLSHVERYFADVLSAMESTDRTIHLHGEAGDLDSGGVKVPAKLKLPDNLFVIGTMNVDETTHMVSPKVLDRAQVLEFRVSHDDIDGFLDKSESVDLGTLTGGGSFAATFLNLAQERGSKKPTGAMNDLKTTLLKAFDELSKLGAEFAFRSTAEIVSFAGFAEDDGLSSDEAIDAAILQKLLPKVHGSRRKLEKPLAALWGICLKSDDKGKDTDKPTTLQATREEFGKDFYESHCRFPWTGEKIARMYRQAVDNGFASFAEA